MSWVIDQRLENDTHLLYDDANMQIRLMNNRAVPWFILVPKVSQTEWHQLDNAQQATLNNYINLLSQHLVSEYGVDKTNVATLGNVVAQMHIHVIGRFHKDVYWPKPVWGLPTQGEYTLVEVRVYEDNLLKMIRGSSRV